MAADHAHGTESPLNSSQPTCSLVGDYGWREEYLTPTNFALLIAAVSAESLMIPFTVLLNALVIFLVWRKRYLRKQKPWVLLACLAATDLLVGAVLLPLEITGHAFRLSRTRVCLVDTACWGVLYIGCGASLCHLVIVSGERYVAIKHSLRYETLVTTNRLIIAVATAWTIPVATTLIALIDVVLTGHAVLADTIYYVLIYLCIPGSFAAICYCQVTMFLETRRHRRHIRAHQVSGAAAKEILKKDKAARTTAMIVGALLLSYAPAIVCDALTLAVQAPTEVVFGTFFIIDLFVHANSLVNPIIYCMRTQDFKRALRELFGLENPAQVNPQAAGNPSARAVRRRISEAPRSSPGNGKKRVAWCEPAPTRISRSHSLDLPRDLTNKRRNHRKNSA